MSKPIEISREVEDNIWYDFYFGGLTYRDIMIKHNLTLWATKKIITRLAPPQPVHKPVS